jgi:hypothetical protein
MREGPRALSGATLPDAHHADHVGEDLTDLTDEGAAAHPVLADAAGVVVGAAVTVGMVVHRLHAGTQRRTLRGLRPRHA